MKMSRLKTWFFMAVLTLLVLATGRVFGGRQGLLVAFVVALVMNVVAYFYSQRIILWTYNARPLEGADPYGLNKMVRELAARVGLPKPHIFIIPSDTPNAFAIGQSPRAAAIAFTEGILKILDKEEIKGVAAHEISHILQRDTMLMMIAATLGSFVMYIANLFNWLSHFGKTPKDSEAPSGVVGSILMAIVSPFAAILIHLAVSRNREYLADGGSKDLTGNPEALASALWKIHHYSENKPLPATVSTAHLFIINPLTGGGLNRLFATHPPVEERIKRLTGRAP